MRPTPRGRPADTAWQAGRRLDLERAVAKASRRGDSAHQPEPAQHDIVQDAFVRVVGRFGHLRGAQFSLRSPDGRERVVPGDPFYVAILT